MRRLRVRREHWPLKSPFAISRLTQNDAEMVVVEIDEDGFTGRGEAEPLDAFGQRGPDPVAEVEALRAEIESGLDRAWLLNAMPPGPARNAVDCALWDLEAKTAMVRAWTLLGIEQPAPVETVYTLGVEAPERMAEAAARESGRPILKLKLGGGTAAEDIARVEAVRRAAPAVRLVADANGGWQPEEVAGMLAELDRLRVEMVEQPLPPERDSALVGMLRAIPVYADESFGGDADVSALSAGYDGVNIKLDKAGGLTHAVRQLQAAKARSLGVMVGCNVGTSLAMAPAFVLAQEADYVDLDGPLLLKWDREPGLRYEGSTVHPPSPGVWG